MIMKRLIIALLFIYVVLGAYAQNQTIDPTVEVNREYQGKMLEITKGKLNTAANDSIAAFKLNFNYSFFEKPYKDMYEFSAVPSASIPKEAPLRTPTFIAKGGIGYPFAPEADIWYFPELAGNHWLNLNGWGNLFVGDAYTATISDGEAEKSSTKVGDKEYSYGIKGKYTHAWRSGELSIYAKFYGGYNKYYGGNHNSSSPIGDHNFNIVEGGFGAKSSGAANYGKKLDWHIKGLLRHTSDKQTLKMQENYGSLSAEIGPTFGRYNKFMVGIDAEALQYRGSAAYYMGLFGITPQYRYENGNFKVNLGIKLQGKFASEENHNKNHTWVMPAVDLSLRLLPEKLWLYGKVGGSNTLNPYSSLLENNRYISADYTPSGLKESSIPLNIEGGFKGRLTDKFSYRLYAAYTIHKGLMQYICNLDEGWFAAEFNQRHSCFSFGGEIGVTTEKVRGGIAIKHSDFTKDLGNTVTGIPELECDLNIGFKFGDKFYADAACHLQSGYDFTYMEGGETDTGAVAQRASVASFADLGATVGYMHSPAVTFWLRGDNLLNSATQYTPLYIGKGRGIMVGIIVKL